MGRILATLVTILILVLGAAFLLPAFVDWNSYRAGIEKTASQVLGRKVSILGAIDISLLPEPHLHASNIAAGNGKADGALLTADAVDISLSLEALFSGRLDAGKLRLLHPVLTLDFSKPFVEPGSATGNGGLPFAADVRYVEIDHGRISVFSKAGGSNEALSLTNIDGVVSATARGDSYRFNGQVSKDGRPYEVKLSATPVAGRGLKLTGSAADTASKLSFHADGLLSASADPSFEGAVAINVPQGTEVANRLPLEIQAKSAVKIGLKNAIFIDLELTADPQNRPQVLTGSADIAFGAQKASIALKSRSLDADALLNGSAWPVPAAAPGDWGALAADADKLLWLRPGYALSLDLEAGLVQLKGEPIENVKLHGERTQGRWVFGQAFATLPGDAGLKLAGTLTRPGQAPQLVASVSLEGKSVGRLARWLIPSLQRGARVPAGAFSLNGSLTLSREVSAFEGVTGSLDATPFTAGLHFNKAPARRLVASLAGDNFDLSAFDSGEATEALSPDSLKAEWQSGLAQLAAMLGAGPEGFETADIDVSAARIKTGGVEAKNVAVHVKFDPDLLTVSKLSADTDSGLALRAEGSVPLRGAGQGRFGGKLEAKSSQAIIQLAALGGIGRGTLERRAQAMAPAVLSISYDAGAAGTAAAELSGNLGSSSIEGSANLKGSLSEWKTAGISAQLRLSSPDGNKLAQQLFPDAPASRGSPASQGLLTVSLSGAAGQLKTQASFGGGGIQGQLDGITDLKAQSFKGKAFASAGAPEQFLSASLLTLMGGEPGANLSLGANVTLSPTRLDARELNAASPGNLVAGKLALGIAGGITQVDGDLQAEKASLPSLLAYFLSPREAPALPSLSAAQQPADLWSGRPFSLPAFEGTEGVILLRAKTMTLSDTVALTNAELHAGLDRGKLAIKTFKGNMLGGSLDASLSLTAKDSVVAADAKLALAHAEPGALASPGTAPLVNAPASLLLSASGQGLSPRGIVSVLQGRGTIHISAGRLTKLSPAGMQTSADELLAQPMPLTEDVVSKKVSDAVQLDDFSFSRFEIPVTVSDGLLEIHEASFRGEDATARMEAYVDLNKALVDSTWQMGGKNWPPIKIHISGPLRELGARPRTVSAEDFIRAILVRKMEGDISRLEGLGKPSQAKPSAAWTARQEPASKPPRRKQEAQPAAKAQEPVQPKSFEQRMRDALENLNGTAR